jgi:hypothetical protein
MAHRDVLPLFRMTASGQSRHKIFGSSGLGATGRAAQCLALAGIEFVGCYHARHVERFQARHAGPPSTSPGGRRVETVVGSQAGSALLAPIAVVINPNGYRVCHLSKAIRHDRRLQCT